jgi:hypothetical protein
MLSAQENRIRWMGIDMRPRWRRRTAVIVTYVTSLAAALWLSSWQGDEWLTPVKALFGLFFAIEFVTVFREGGLVKTFQDPQLILGAAGKSWGLRWGKFLMRSSSKYKYTTPEKQQEMLRRLEQGFPYTIQPDQSGDAPDERERAERDIASRRTLQFLSVILIYNAVNTGMQGKSWTAVQVVSAMLTYLVIARTGPKARILWSEPDPRDAPGEIQLVPTEV